MKNSPAYSLGSNIKYSLRTHWSAKKSTLIFCALDTVMSVILPFVRILLPKLVIDELTAGATPAHFLAVVGGAAALLIALGYVKGYTDVIATIRRNHLGSAVCSGSRCQAHDCGL